MITEFNIKHDLKLILNKYWSDIVVHYNANEYRSLVNYPLIYILKNQFSDETYYYNIIKYILFLRLLRQDVVTEIIYKIAKF